MARSYFSYSVIRSDPTNLTTGGDSIVTSLKNVDWEVKKLDESNSEISTSIYTAITGNTTISGAAGTTDWNGLIEFWANPGQYVIKVTDPSSRIANKNIYWDSVSGQIGGIPGDLLTSESVTSTQIKNSEIKTEDINNEAITTSKINNEAVTTSKIATGTIVNANINASAEIDGSKIKSNSVSDSQISNGAFVPIGAVIPYAGATAPTNWLLCDGSEKAVATYSALDAVLGTTYGARTNGSGGAGSSHFRLPDMRGRVAAGKDDMGGSAASRLTSTVLSASNTLGAVGGTQTHTMTSAEMPSHTHIQNSHNHTQNAHTHIQNSHNHIQNPHNHLQNAHNHTPNQSANSFYVGVSTGGDFLAKGSDFRFDYTGAKYNVTELATATNQPETATNIANTATNQETTATNIATTATNQNTGGGEAHANTQPTIILNYIIRAL